MSTQNLFRNKSAHDGIMGIHINDTMMDSDEKKNYSSVDFLAGSSKNASENNDTIKLGKNKQQL